MTNSSFKTIGVLGGMGPEATILLQQRLVDSVQAETDSDHLPLLIDMNPQVPSRIARLIEGTGEDPGPTLAAMAKRLETAGAAALAMPCNTAHYYAPAIVEAVDIPLLNMVDLAVERAVSTVPKGGSVGILASPAVRKIALFDTPLAAHGLSAVWPENEAAMLAAIREIKTSGATETARNALAFASKELHDKGAHMQFIACSEFSIISDSVFPGALVVDTVDLLVDAILQAAQSD